MTFGVLTLTRSALWYILPYINLGRSPASTEYSHVEEPYNAYLLKTYLAFVGFILFYFFIADVLFG
jgi:hypothetical protein